MTHKREQEELLKRKAATGASVVPLIPDREKVGDMTRKREQEELLKSKVVTGWCQFCTLIPDI
jgi:hypothetical protein